MNMILGLVEMVAFVIGLFGIAVIAVGAIKAAWQYLKSPKGSFDTIRCTIADHLLLGLDFLVAKDVADTFLLDSGNEFWEDLVALLAVVAVRIVLTHFMIKEIREMQATKKSAKK